MLTDEVDVGGAVVRYDWREGAGRPLVLVPGWCCPRTDWYAVTDLLDSVPCAIVDLPGQGDSSSGDHRWTIADFADAVAAVIRRLGMSETVVVGHSMGGAVAIETARARPDVVRQVVCIDSLTYETLYPRQGEAAVQAGVAAVDEAFNDGMRELVASLFLDKDSPLIEEVAAGMARSPQREARWSMRSLLEWDRDIRVAAVSVPIDAIVAEGMLAPGALDRLPGNVRTKLVSLGGHFFLREQPAATATTIRSVLDARTG